jgi:hypothetical protein
MLSTENFSEGNNLFTDLTAEEANDVNGGWGGLAQKIQEVIEGLFHPPSVDPIEVCPTFPIPLPFPWGSLPLL